MNAYAFGQDTKVSHKEVVVYQMWWRPEVLLRKPSLDTMRDSREYVEMWCVVAPKFTDDVYCEECAVKVERSYANGQAQRAAVWVRNHGQCAKCGEHFLAERPAVIYASAVSVNADQILGEEQRKEYVIARWNFNRNDGTCVAYCERCKAPNLDNPLYITRTVLRRGGFMCGGCHEMVYPENMEDKMRDMPPGVEASETEDQSPKKQDHKAELMGWASSGRQTVERFFLGLDNFAMHKRELEKIERQMELLRGVMQTASQREELKTADTQRDAAEIVDRFHDAWQVACEEHGNAGELLESTHEQLGRMLESMAYHTSALLLEVGEKGKTNCIPAWVDEGVQRAVDEHEKKGEASCQSDSPS
jgi:hypothetical protein